MVFVGDHAFYGCLSFANFTISWATNGPVVVDVCTHLAAPAWQPRQTNNLNHGVCAFTDPAAAALPCRFYRI